MKFKDTDKKHFQSLKLHFSQIWYTEWMYMQVMQTLWINW